MSDIRKILNIINETTSSGAVATGPATNLFMNKRTDEYAAEDSSSEPEAPKVLEYGNWENSALSTSKKLKKTRKKAAKTVKSIYDESLDGVAPSTKMFTSEGATKTRNPVAKAAQRVAKGSGKHKNPAKTIPRKQKYKSVYEEENLSEMDLIVSPSSKSKLDRALISKDRAHHDHEVDMARGDLYQAAKNATEVLKLIKDRSEMEGLEGWVQEKIVKASDYLNTIREYLQNKSVQHRLQQSDSMGLEEDAGEQTYPPAPDWLKEILAQPEFQIAENIAEQGVAEGAIQNDSRSVTINEFDYSSELGELALTNQQIMSNSTIDGKIGSRSVHLFKQGANRIYFFESNNKIDALVYLHGDRLFGMKNYSSNKGLNYNLFQYIINIKRQKVRLSPIDKLTHNGLNWIISQIQRPTGFKITGGDGNPVTASDVFSEWETARITGKHGPTELIISQSSNASQIRANESRLMPMDIWGATLSESAKNTPDISELYESFNLKSSVAEGSEKHKQSRLWAMIADYEQRAKATKNDIKKQHYMKMADELRGKLKTSDDQDVTEARASESKYWRVEQSEATGRYYVVKGYQKRTIWSSKSGASDFNSKAAAEKKVAELNQKEDVAEGKKKLTYLLDVSDGSGQYFGGDTVEFFAKNDEEAKEIAKKKPGAKNLRRQIGYDNFIKIPMNAKEEPLSPWYAGVGGIPGNYSIKEDVAEDKGSIIDKCASLAAKYFNSEGLQREYDIDEFIKNNAGTDQIINKCASLAAKYFNSDGLQNQYDIDEYIKANVKQDVTKDKPSDSK